MGLIKAATSSVGGGLADQWLEVIEPDNMGDTTVMTKGVLCVKMINVVLIVKERTMF